MGIDEKSEELDSASEVYETHEPAPLDTTAVSPYDALKKVREEEWKNIPNVVKQTFRSLIDFVLDQK